MAAGPISPGSNLAGEDVNGYFADHRQPGELLDGRVVVGPSSDDDQTKPVAIPLGELTRSFLHLEYRGRIPPGDHDHQIGVVQPSADAVRRGEPSRGPAAIGPADGGKQQAAAIDQEIQRTDARSCRALEQSLHEGHRDHACPVAGSHQHLETTRKELQMGVDRSADL